MKSELYIAIEEGNTGVALALVAAGADLDNGLVMSDGETNSNLYEAICRGNTKVALALIAAGADLGSGRVMSCGNSCSNLYEAICRGNTEVALELINRGADLNPGYISRMYYTIFNLYEAIEANNTEVALALIEKGADLNVGKVFTTDKTTLNLYKAIKKDNASVALKLIEAGAQLSDSIYNEGIKKPEIAKALFRRLYQGDGFPSLSALSMFSLQGVSNPRMISSSDVEQYFVYAQDRAFLMDHGTKLALPSAEVARACRVPLKYFSSLLKRAVSEADQSQHGACSKPIVIKCLIRQPREFRARTGAFIDIAATPAIDTRTKRCRHVCWQSLFLAIYKGNTEKALALIAKGAELSVSAYNMGIKNPKIAKALFERLYQDECFPSLASISLFNQPGGLSHHEAIFPRVVKYCRTYAQDKEFLRDCGTGLSLPSKEVAAECGIPKNPLSMFKVRHK